jgi:hypothetical protein
MNAAPPVLNYQTRAIIIVIAISLVVRTVLAAVMGFSFDETYNIVVAREFALSYYDQDGGHQRTLYLGALGLLAFQRGGCSEARRVGHLHLTAHRAERPRQFLAGIVIKLEAAQRCGEYRGRQPVPWLDRLFVEEFENFMTATQGRPSVIGGIEDAIADLGIVQSVYQRGHR